MSDDAPIPLKRGAYKRQLRVIQPVPPKTPKAVTDALRAGAVYCPRKWGEIATQQCAHLQSLSSSLCKGARCQFVGHAEAFEREAAKAKVPANVAPKPARKARLSRLAEQREQGAGDFAEGDDDELAD